MTEPADRESFVLKFTESQLDSRCDVQRGLGLPCPFCAAPNYTKYPIHEVGDGAHIVQTCEECGRSGKFFFETIVLQGLPAQKFYVLQVGGPPQNARLGHEIGWVH